MYKYLFQYTEQTRAHDSRLDQSEATLRKNLFSETDLTNFWSYKKKKDITSSPYVFFEGVRNK